MRRRLGSVADRMLGLFLPTARAGACPCAPGGDGHWETRCFGHLIARRWCVDKCDCSVKCGPWQNTMTIC